MAELPPIAKTDSSTGLSVSDAEVMEYATWLGLSDSDKHLFWIARQALETTIPSPWIECQTGDGEIFFYNTRTKESVWDHPFDGYYKSAINRYKSGEFSESELIRLVTQPWLLSGTDNRSSHKSMDEASSAGLLPLSDGQQSNQATVAAPPPEISPSLFSLQMSPNRGRKRASSIGITGGSPSLRISMDSGDMHALEIELMQAKNALQDSANSNKYLRNESQSMKNDLIKAREYIELLLLENSNYRSRMTEAIGFVKQLDRDSNLLQQNLHQETLKREIAEKRVRELEAKIQRLKFTNNTGGSSAFARLCGNSCGSGERNGGTKSVIAGGSSNGGRSGVSSAPSTPPPRARETNASMNKLLTLLNVTNLPTGSTSSTL